MKKEKYQIDIPKVREIQKRIWERIKETHPLSKAKIPPIYAHYGGVFEIGTEKLVIHTDGVGTKVMVAEALNKFDTIGIDAIAMNVNDIVCMGARPLVGVDYIVMKKEDPELVEEIMKGLVKGAKESGCAIIGGETAIMPDFIAGGDKNIDLSFTVVGRIEKLITGENITPGDVLIGLPSSGLHSNGFTLARKILDIKKWGREMLIPTKIYVKDIMKLVEEGVELHGIAHITGGAFSKLTRLNKEVNFYINNMPKPKGIFEEILKHVDVKEAYKTFNMGIGMVLAVPDKEEKKVKEIIPNAMKIGEVREGKGVILNYEGKELDISING